MINTVDLEYLHRCIELARQALDQGNPPFGSLLIDRHGDILAEDYNQISHGDRTHHPELKVAQWACQNMTPCQRHHATVYTSGEHCPMCAAAHGWAGLGRIVYVASSAQLQQWHRQWGIKPSNVNVLPITDIITGICVDGPAQELSDTVRELHRQFHQAHD